MGFWGRVFNVADEAELTPRERRHLRAEQNNAAWVKQKARMAQELAVRKQKAARVRDGRDARPRQRNNFREW